MSPENPHSHTQTFAATPAAPTKGRTAHRVAKRLGIAVISGLVVAGLSPLAVMPGFAAQTSGGAGAANREIKHTLDVELENGQHRDSAGMPEALKKTTDATLKVIPDMPSDPACLTPTTANPDGKFGNGQNGHFKTQLIFAHQESQNPTESKTCTYTVTLQAPDSPTKGVVYDRSTYQVTWQYTPGNGIDQAKKGTWQRKITKDKFTEDAIKFLNVVKYWSVSFTRNDDQSIPVNGQIMQLIADGDTHAQLPTSGQCANNQAVFLGWLKGGKGSLLSEAQVKSEISKLSESVIFNASCAGPHEVKFFAEKTESLDGKQHIGAHLVRHGTALTAGQVPDDVSKACLPSFDGKEKKIVGWQELGTNLPVQSKAELVNPQNKVTKSINYVAQCITRVPATVTFTTAVGKFAPGPEANGNTLTIKGDVGDQIPFPSENDIQNKPSNKIFAGWSRSGAEPREDQGKVTFPNGGAQYQAIWKDKPEPPKPAPAPQPTNTAKPEPPVKPAPPKPGPAPSASKKPEVNPGGDSGKKPGKDDNKKPEAKPNGKPEAKPGENPGKKPQPQPAPHESGKPNPGEGKKPEVAPHEPGKPEAPQKDESKPGNSGSGDAGNSGGSSGSSGGSSFGGFGGALGGSTPSQTDQTKTDKSKDKAEKDKAEKDKAEKDKAKPAEKKPETKFDKQFQKPVKIAPSAVKRAAGVDRVGTSVSAFTQAKNQQVAVLATGNNFPDALMGGALAGAYKGAVMLSTGETLEPSVLNALKAAGTKTVHVIGGYGAISAAKEAQLRAAGIEVVRHAGADRYETARKIKDATRAALGLKGNAKSAVSCNATGTNFPDALACAAAAARMGGTVDLVRPGSRVASDNQAKTTICAGGAACAGAGTGVNQVVGSDRYETAYRLAEIMPNTGTVMVANGKSYADSLVAGALAPSLNASLVLSDSRRVNVPTGTRAAHLFGGRAALPENLPVFTK